MSTERYYEDLDEQKETLYNELETVLGRHHELVRREPDFAAAALIQTATALRNDLGLSVEAWAETDDGLEIVSEHGSEDILIIGFGGEGGAAGMFFPDDDGAVTPETLRKLDDAGHDTSVLRDQFEVKR